MCVVVRFLIGAYPAGNEPDGPEQTLYFANHTSHLDTLTLLAALSPGARARTRPVAARDYWCASPLRHWVAEKVLNVVFIDRQRQAGDPLDPVRAALAEGWSLIMFPEGTRRDQQLPSEFKSGIYRLASEFPDLHLKPVYLENLHRILPKGSMLPLPLINRVHFGQALARLQAEDKTTFLARAHAAVCELCPGTEP
ncbi:lysophospholipid acyltransferase family protein [Ramlibacter aurantiacus]|uniref:lysophospholipid acyltransferase family protein n=1 Tax=Ramlibacter aurantiacus TaxID=2801330 RepID=UPI003F496DF5